MKFYLYFLHTINFLVFNKFKVELNNEEKTPMIASHIKGTLAYLPPEFTTSKVITTKLDVYSFGVVLLEVAIGNIYFL